MSKARPYGIVLGWRDDWRMAYGPNGFGARWMPHRVQGWIVHAFNWTACLFGSCDRMLCNIHLDPKRTRCVNCLRPLVATEQERGYAVQNEAEDAKWRAEWMAANPDAGVKP